MCSDHCNALAERELKPARISHRLILADQTELVSHVAEKRQAAICEGAIKQFVFRVGRIELLCVRQHLHEHGAGIGTAMHLVDGVTPLRVDRDARKKVIRVRSTLQAF